MITVALGIILAIFIIVMLLIILPALKELFGVVISLALIGLVIFLFTEYPNTLLPPIMFLVGIVGVIFLLFAILKLLRLFREAGGVSSYIGDLFSKCGLAITNKQKTRKLENLLAIDKRVEENKKILQKLTIKKAGERDNKRRRVINNLQKKFNSKVRDSTKPFETVDFFQLTTHSEFSSELPKDTISCDIQNPFTSKLEFYAVYVDQYKNYCVLPGSMREPSWDEEGPGFQKQYADYSLLEEEKFRSQRKALKYLVRVLRQRIKVIRSN